MKPIRILSILAAALLLESCAGSVRDGAGAVLIVTDPSQVKDCAFLGRVSQASTEGDGASEGMLRQRTAEMGGNTLLIRAAGSGEAWNCSQKVSAWSPGTQPTPTPIGAGRFRTPFVTPRT